MKVSFALLRSRVPPSHLVPVYNRVIGLSYSLQRVSLAADTSTLLPSTEPPSPEMNPLAGKSLWEKGGLRSTPVTISEGSASPGQRFLLEAGNASCQYDDALEVPVYPALLKVGSAVTKSLKLVQRMSSKWIQHQVLSRTDKISLRRGYGLGKLC